MFTFLDEDFEQRALAKDLYAFARRVALDENATSAELVALPKVVEILFRISND